MTKLPQASTVAGLCPGFLNPLIVWGRLDTCQISSSAALNIAGVGENKDGYESLFSLTSWAGWWSKQPPV